MIRKVNNPYAASLRWQSVDCDLQLKVISWVRKLDLDFHFRFFRNWKKSFQKRKNFHGFNLDKIHFYRIYTLNLAGVYKCMLAE